MQLGIFECSGPIQEKGALKLFKENAARGITRVLLGGCQRFSLEKRILPFKILGHNMITDAERAPLQW